MSDAESDEAEPRAVVLDYLAHGRTDDGGRGYDQSAIGYAVEDEEFRLYEVSFAEDADVSIGDRIAVASGADDPNVERAREIEYDDLSGGAQSELEYVVEEVVEADERRFVDVYNDAQPITLRLHQLNLLPGIGDKLRDGILDQRKRKPFESFEDLEERVDGLHDPEGVIVDRIMEELTEDDLKYRMFARRDE